MGFEIEGENEPRTYRDAINSCDKDKWLASIEDEMKSIYQNKHLGIG